MYQFYQNCSRCCDIVETVQVRTNKHITCLCRHWRVAKG